MADNGGNGSVILTLLIALPVGVFLAVLIAVFVVARLRRTRREHQELRDRVHALTSENTRLMKMAEFDDLTSARSRRYMRELFSRNPQDGSNAMVFLDLDNFKSVNDGFGHRAGDALLRRIADNLGEVCREGEVLFRLGGDEFCIYLPKVSIPDAAKRAEGFVSVVAASSVVVNGVKVRRSTSAGVARVDAGQDLVGALYYADEALYAAKKAGGNTVRVTEGETLRTMIARRTGPRPEDLAEAIRRDEVTYYVQPIFDTRINQPVGVEALIRWVRKDGRVLLPAKFLDAMMGSQTTQIVPPLQVAASVADRFSPLSDDFYCAFNISAQFLGCDHSDSARLIDEMLGALDPKHTVFELVESAAIRNPGETRYLLDQLRERGVRVALDDFGTGMSNLQRLNMLNVDIVKIDRSFVKGLGTAGKDTSILRALHDMSQSMGFDVIAEGVETEAELAVLQDIGIFKAQGYLLGRPAKADYWQQRLGSLDPVPLQIVAQA